jgi:hypothetical protein
MMMLPHYGAATGPLESEICHLQSSEARRAGNGTVAVCKDPQQPQDILRVLETAKKDGLEILPPPRV